MSSVNTFGIPLPEREVLLFGGAGIYGYIIFQEMAILWKEKLFPKTPSIVVCVSSGFPSGLLAYCGVDINKIIDDPSLKNISLIKNSVVKGIYNVLTTGFYGDFAPRVSFLDDLLKVINQETNLNLRPESTLSELLKKTGRLLIVPTVDIDTQGVFYLSAYTTPDVTLLDAILATTGYLPYIPPASVKMPNGRIARLADGGYNITYPWGVIDPNYRFYIEKDPYYKGPSLEKYFRNVNNILGFRFVGAETAGIRRDPEVKKYFSVPIIDILSKINAVQFSSKDSLMPEKYLNPTITTLGFFIPGPIFTLTEELEERMQVVANDTIDRSLTLYYKSKYTSVDNLPLDPHYQK